MIDYQYFTQMNKWRPWVKEIEAWRRQTIIVVSKCTSLVPTFVVALHALFFFKVYTLWYQMLLYVLFSLDFLILHLDSCFIWINLWLAYMLNSALMLCVIHIPLDPSCVNYLWFSGMYFVCFTLHLYHRCCHYCQCMHCYHQIGSMYICYVFWIISVYSPQPTRETMTHYLCFFEVLFQITWEPFSDH